MAITPTPRFGLKQFSSGADPHPTRLEHNAMIAAIESNAAMTSQGTLAARPTAGKVGRIYWATDAARIYYDDGMAWGEVSPVGGGGAGRPLVVNGTAIEGTAERAARADHTHNVPLATATVNGAMLAADKKKLDAAASAATPSTLAIRDAAGTVSVSTPTAAAHATTKAYVDGRIQEAADYADDAVFEIPFASATEYGHMSAADKVKLDAATGAATPLTLALRNTEGQTMVASPTAATHAANKDYVDRQVGTKANTSHVHDGAHITTGTISDARIANATAALDGLMPKADKSKLDRASAAATPNTLVMNDANGRFQVATPAGTTDAVNKAYVDAETAKRVPFLGSIGATNLNTVVIEGQYFQDQDANVTLENGYPLAAGRAGALIVTCVSSLNYRLQEWTEWSTGRRWIRGTTTRGATWQPWTEQATAALATSGRHGLMDAVDKVKLDRANSGAVTNSLALRNGDGDAAFRRVMLTETIDNSSAARKDYVDGQIAAKAAPAVHTHTLADVTVKTLWDTEDLDNITDQGLYHQSQNVNASLERHYPINQAGLLEVTGALGNFVYQRYTTYKGSDRIFIRARYSGAWSVWKEQSSTDHKHAGEDITSGTISDARIANASATKDGLMPKGDKSKLDTTTSYSTPNSIAVRNTQGTFEVGAPTAATHVASKGYVDTEVAKKANASHSHTTADISAGNLEMTTLRLSSTVDGSETSTGHALQIGPDNSTNLVIDNNEIIGRVNGVLDLISMPGGLWGLPAPLTGSTATNKDYVDTQVAKKANTSHSHDGTHITTGTISDLRIANASATKDGLLNKADKATLDAATYLPTPGTLVKRHSTAGTLHVETGVGPKDAVNRSYVDGITTPLVNNAVEVFTSAPIAGAAKPAGVPYKHFKGFVLVGEGAGGEVRTQSLATDADGVGGVWFGFQDLPRFSGIYGVNMNTKSSVDTFLTSIAFVDVSLDRIKFRARRMDDSGTLKWANGFGDLMLYIDILGW